MTTRTYKQQGKAFGNQPVTIVAKINGEIVHDGEIETVNEILKQGPESDIGSTDFDLFSWSADMDFDGLFEMEISVTSPGVLMITDTVANYAKIFDDVTQKYTSSGPDQFEPYYNEEIGDPVKLVTVNGIEVERIRDQDPDFLLNGQWYYRVEPGEVLNCQIQATPGME